MFSPDFSAFALANQDFSRKPRNPRFIRVSSSHQVGRGSVMSLFAKLVPSITGAAVDTMVLMALRRVSIIYILAPGVANLPPGILSPVIDPRHLCNYVVKSCKRNRSIGGKSRCRIGGESCKGGIAHQENIEILREIVISCSTSLITDVCRITDKEHVPYSLLSEEGF